MTVCSKDCINHSDRCHLRFKVEFCEAGQLKTCVHTLFNYFSKFLNKFIFVQCLLSFFLSVAQTLLEKYNFQELQVRVHWHVYNRRYLQCVCVCACVTAVVLCILQIHSSTEAPCPQHCQLHNYNPMSAPSLLGFACRNTKINNKKIIFTCSQIIC